MRIALPLAAALALAACGQQAAPPAEAKADANTIAPEDERTAAQRAYADASARMHAGMSAAIHADADVAFMQGMLAHHKGAVEMSEVALKYGKDAKVRDLATRIIKAQQSEIAEMQGWLDARAKGASSDPAKAPAVADPHAGH